MVLKSLISSVCKEVQQLVIPGSFICKNSVIACGVAVLNM
jgi:hypothetical protein